MLRVKILFISIEDLRSLHELKVVVGFLNVQNISSKGGFFAF